MDTYMYIHTIVFKAAFITIASRKQSMFLLTNEWVNKRWLSKLHS